MHIKIDEFLRFSRYKDWHYGKMPLLFSLLFILGLQSSEYVSFLSIVQWYTIFALFLCFAYMINNISDLEIDAKAGKDTGLRNWSVNAKLIVTYIIAIIGIIIGAVCLNFYSFLFLIACYTIAWTYSFPPRFKENIIIGPIVASVGQLCFPGIVLIAQYQIFSLCVICYVLLIFLWGLRMILVHQVIDMSNDLKTGVKTSVLTLGIERSRKFLRSLLKMEVVLVIVQLVLLLKTGLEYLTLVLLLPPLLHVIMRVKYKLAIRLDSYEYIPMADVYEIFIPLMLAISLIHRSDGKIWWILILVAVLFGSRYWERLTSAYYSFQDLQSERQQQ